MPRGRTITGLFGLAVLTMGSGFCTPPVASELARGQVVVAFGPELTGDPTADFAHAVGTGDTVTIYLISGPLPAPARRFSFGLGVSESHNLMVSEVRSFDFVRVNATQDDLGTIIRVAVTGSPICFDFNSQEVIAEVDLVRVGGEVQVQIELGGYLYESASAPEMESCQAVVIFFDDSQAQQLSVQPPVPTPVARTCWATIKRLYR